MPPSLPAWRTADAGAESPAPTSNSGEERKNKNACKIHEQMFRVTC